MEMLILVRDVILAVLLSWIGIDYDQVRQTEAQIGADIRIQVRAEALTALPEFLVLETSHTQENRVCTEELFRS